MLFVAVTCVIGVSGMFVNKVKVFKVRFSGLILHIFGQVMKGLGLLTFNEQGCVSVFFSSMMFTMFHAVKVVLQECLSTVVHYFCLEE